MKDVARIPSRVRRTVSLPRFCQLTPACLARAGACEVSCCLCDAYPPRRCRPSEQRCRPRPVRERHSIVEPTNAITLRFPNKPVTAAFLPPAPRLWLRRCSPPSASARWARPLAIAEESNSMKRATGSLAAKCWSVPPRRPPRQRHHDLGVLSLPRGSKTLRSRANWRNSVHAASRLALTVGVRRCVNALSCCSRRRTTS